MQKIIHPQDEVKESTHEETVETLYKKILEDYTEVFKRLEQDD